MSSTHHGRFIQLPYSTRGSSLVSSMAKDKLLLKFPSPGFCRTRKEKPKTVALILASFATLDRMSRVTLLWEICSKCGCLAKILLIVKRNWTKSSLENLTKRSYIQLRPTTLVIFKNRPSEHYTIKMYSPYNWQDSFLLLYWNP